MATRKSFEPSKLLWRIEPIPQHQPEQDQRIKAHLDFLRDTRGIEQELFSDLKRMPDGRLIVGWRVVRGPDTALEEDRRFTYQPLQGTQQAMLNAAFEHLKALNGGLVDA